MRLARYVGDGRVSIVDEPVPVCPDGGIVVETLASAICSGELMQWYMDAKMPHVLGHEVAGRVVTSECALFPVGALVAPHHHAACGNCDECKAGRSVHCPFWKPARFIPGGLAERFAVTAEGLTDCHRVDDLRPRDAALAEPLACVVKSLRRLGTPSPGPSVVGLGALGIAHLLLAPGGIGYDHRPERRAWAANLGIEARSPEEAAPARHWVVCPGSDDALALALDNLLSDATVLLFAPWPAQSMAAVDLSNAYFLDARIVTSYSAGSGDMETALGYLRTGQVRAEQLVSHFIELSEVPEAYDKMRVGSILKAMAVFE